MPDHDPTLFLIGGCDGAGKTTFARRLLPMEGVELFLRPTRSPGASPRSNPNSPLYAPDASCWRTRMISLPNGSHSDWRAP